MKKILIASTVALFVGGWWFGAGGTYGSPEEASEKAKAWVSKGKTWTVTKTKTRKATKRVYNQNYSKLLQEYNLAMERYKDADYNNREICKKNNYIWIDPCMAELGLKLPPKPSKKPAEYNYDLVEVVDKNQVEESTRKCKSSGKWGKDFQKTCQIRPVGAKGWYGAKYVYFKVK